MKIKCVKCGWANEVNPAALLGKTKSAAKSAAARENGKLGGRPKTKRVTRRANDPSSPTAADGAGGAERKA